MGSHHHHGHHHNDEEFDYGVLYEQQWVKDQIGKIQGFIRANVAWMGIATSLSQRVLDYACGHGTISLALASECPNAIFRGIDSQPKQVRRYNDEAAKLFGEEDNRMYAMVDDLNTPSPALDQADWQNFDVAVISMALHHVPDPIAMLTELQKRLKTGGTLTVVEMIEPSHETTDSFDQADMIDAVGGQKIWPGFTPRSLGDMLERDGFIDVDAKVPDLYFEIPAHIPGSGSAQRKQLMFVKATKGQSVVRNEL